MKISIHAPRGGSDPGTCKPLCKSGDFNPRSPRGERRQANVVITPTGSDFNPRSPRGERHKYFDYFTGALPISIHAPRGGSDNLPERKPSPAGSISIHAPRGGSDHHQAVDSRATPVISIHAPRGGSDRWTAVYLPVEPVHFNPRSPRGERHVSAKEYDNIKQISIHAPRGGSDCH